MSTNLKTSAFNVAEALMQPIVLGTEEWDKYQKDILKEGANNIFAPDTSLIHDLPSETVVINDSSDSDSCYNQFSASLAIRECFEMLAQGTSHKPNIQLPPQINTGASKKVADLINKFEAKDKQEDAISDLAFKVFSHITEITVTKTTSRSIFTAYIIKRKIQDVLFEHAISQEHSQRHKLKSLLKRINGVLTKLSDDEKQKFENLKTSVEKKLNEINYAEKDGEVVNVESLLKTQRAALKILKFLATTRQRQIKNVTLTEKQKNTLSEYLNCLKKYYVTDLDFEKNYLNPFLEILRPANK